MSLVWELDLPQSQKFVLLAFADHADDEGYCRPSVERVAWKTGYEKRQVIRIGKKLRQSGLLKLIKKARPELGFSAIYRIHAEVGSPLPEFKKKAGDKMSPATKDFLGPAEDISSSAEDIAMSSQPSLQPSQEPKPKKSPSDSPGASAPAWAIEFQKYWNENRGVLPDCRELTKNRVQKLRLRTARENFVANFYLAVQKAAKTPFLRGENTRGWRCNFDFLIENDTHVVQILEGKYDGVNHEQSNVVAGNLLAEKERLEKKYGIS